MCQTLLLAIPWIKSLTYFTKSKLLLIIKGIIMLCTTKKEKNNATDYDTPLIGQCTLISEMVKYFLNMLFKFLN